MALIAQQKCVWYLLSHFEKKEIQHMSCLSGCFSSRQRDNYVERLPHSFKRHGWMPGENVPDIKVCKTQQSLQTYLDKLGEGLYQAPVIDFETEDALCVRKNYDGTAGVTCLYSREDDLVVEMGLGAGGEYSANGSGLIVLSVNKRVILAARSVLREPPSQFQRSCPTQLKTGRRLELKSAVSADGINPLT